MSDFYIYSIVVVILIVSVIPVVIIGKRRWEKQIEDAFGGRQELTERDFYEKYFESKGVPFYVVKKIREILEDVLDADLSRLSSEDDFAKNLNFFWQNDSLADVEIFEKIEEEFEIKLNPSDFENLETLNINDIVTITWRKIREREEN